MPEVGIKYRTAESHDIDEINALIYASKAYWGYTDDFMERFMNLFSLTAKYLAKNTVHIMLKGNQIIGVCGFQIVNF